MKGCLPVGRSPVAQAGFDSAGSVGFMPVGFRPLGRSPVLRRTIFSFIPLNVTKQHILEWGTSQSWFRTNNISFLGDLLLQARMSHRKYDVTCVRYLKTDNQFVVLGEGKVFFCQRIEVDEKTNSNQVFPNRISLGRKGHIAKFRILNLISGQTKLQNLIFGGFNLHTSQISAISACFVAKFIDI